MRQKSSNALAKRKTTKSTAFKRALAKTMRRHGRTLELLAAYDRGEYVPAPAEEEKE